MTSRFIFFATFIFASISIFGQAGYPVPTKTNKMLFYLQRSHNKNTIIYDVNLHPDGRINIEKPVRIYWMRFEEGGRLDELSFLQRKAFGIDCQLIDKTNESFIIKFNQYNKRKIYLNKAIWGKYKAYIIINNELAEFSSAFIKSTTNPLGMPLSMEYIVFHGVSVKTGKVVSEIINL